MPGNSVNPSDCSPQLHSPLPRSFPVFPPCLCLISPHPNPVGAPSPRQPHYCDTPPPPHSKTAAKDLQRRSDNTFRDINSSPAKTGDVGDALRPDLQTTPEAYDKVGPGVVYTTYVGAQGGGTGARGVK